MRCVTLLLTGVPRYVTLPDLSYNLDRLFNTDEIATFKIRDLPNHPQSNKRQIALDFRTGYDAMAAQEKLEGYTYELENGREYTLHARINKADEYMRSGSWSPEYCSSSQWYGDEWMPLSMIPNVSDRDMYRAHARLDAQLELLNKQKLVLEKEKELLNEKQRLKRHYGSMQTSDTGNDVPSKRSRSKSRENWSGSRPQRSRSRELRLLKYGHRSQSKERYVLPQIEWHEAGATRSLRQAGRSRSRERRSSSLDSRVMSKERSSITRSSSEEPTVRPKERSQSRDKTSRSRERISRSKERRSRSRPRRSRSRPQRSRSRTQRSRSKARKSRSRDHRSWETRHRERINSRERRSRSNDRRPYRRSRSRHRDSKSRERHNRHSRSDNYRTGRRLRSPDRRMNQMYQSHRPMRERSPADNSKSKSDIKNKIIVKTEKNAKDLTKETENKAVNQDKNQQSKEKTLVDKYNSKLKKSERQEFRVQTLSKDVMILTAILLDEIMDREKIKISASNKVDLIKQFENIVQERLEPLARLKKNTDIEVMKSYKAKYPVEGDIIIIKGMLEKTPKLEVIEPQATVTVPPVSETRNAEVWNLDSDHTQQESTNLPQVENEAPIEIEDTQIKEEPKDEPVIIDLDSPDKPVPKHPQFVLVIKTLVKNMNKVIRANNLGDDIKFAELKHVLRHILRNMLKGQGFVPRDEIIRRFREVYPMEQDESFVRKMIQDIKVGKYPSLTGHVVDAPVNESPDDVLVIEKHYDVVTVADSDDEADTKPGPTVSATRIETSCVNNRQDKPAEAVQVNIIPNHPGQVMTGSADPGKTMAVPADLSKNLPDLTDVPNTMTGPSHAGITKTGPVDPGKIVTGIGNPGKTLTGFGHSGKAMIAGPTDRSKTKAVPNDLGQIGLASSGKTTTGLTGPANPGKSMTGPTQSYKTIASLANAFKTMTRPADPAKTMTGRAQPGIAPAHSGKIKIAPIHLSNTIRGPTQPAFITQNTFNASPIVASNTARLTQPGKTMTGTTAYGNTVTGTTAFANTMTDSTNTGVINIVNQPKTKTGAQVTANPGKSLANPVNIATRPAKTCQAKVPAKSLSKKENMQNTRDLDDTIENLESKEIQETPDKIQALNSKEDRNKNVKENDNNLKVTAITIVTSLNELIAKTTNKPEEEPIDEIKKEVEVKEETELDEGSLMVADNAPRVTSITIMTSDAELFSLGQEKEDQPKKEVDDIKNETDVFYDAEDNLVANIEHAFNDATFSRNIMETNLGNKTIVNNSEQTNTAEQLSKTVNQNNKAQDEEESIESIVKYVASLY